MIRNNEGLMVQPGLRVAARAAIITSALALALGQTALAQPPATAPASSGIYTAAQAERGNNLYQNNCAVCHGGSLQGEEENPPLSGKHFNTSWGGKPIADLYNFIGSQMPLGQPGALGSQGNAAGAKELPPDTNVLGTITVDKR
jgi:mono/diheme cytochrome c family protein